MEKKAALWKIVVVSILVAVPATIVTNLILNSCLEG